MARRDGCLQSPFAAEKLDLLLTVASVEKCVITDTADAIAQAYEAEAHLMAANDAHNAAQSHTNRMAEVRSLQTLLNLRRNRFPWIIDC